MMPMYGNQHIVVLNFWRAVYNYKCNYEICHISMTNDTNNTYKRTSTMSYLTNTYRLPSRHDNNCNQKYSFPGLLELFPPCVLWKSQSIIIFCKYAVLNYLWKILSVLTTYIILGKKLLLERHHNFLSKEVLQAYVLGSFEFIEKSGLSWLLAIIVNITDIAIWVRYVAGLSEFYH